MLLRSRDLWNAAAPSAAPGLLAIIVSILLAAVVAAFVWAANETVHTGHPRTSVAPEQAADERVGVVAGECAHQL